MSPDPNNPNDPNDPNTPEPVDPNVPETVSLDPRCTTRSTLLSASSNASTSPSSALQV